MEKFPDYLSEEASISFFLQVAVAADRFILWAKTLVRFEEVTIIANFTPL
jgi:hypothetical protein